MANEKILIAEDEIELAEALSAILEYNSYDSNIVANGAEALRMAKENSYDVIILDIMMPIMDGITAMKEMRNTGINTPIILLTAKSQTDDKVFGLDSGANDYLTKPFHKEELLARIRALTRSNDENKKKYIVGNITFDKENLELSNGKEVFHLNNKESDIMEIMIKNSGKAISEDEISKRVWSDSQNQSGAVNMYMSYLQDKLSALDANFKIDSLNNNFMLNNNKSLIF